MLIQLKHVVVSEKPAKKDMILTYQHALSIVLRRQIQTQLIWGNKYDQEIDTDAVEKKYYHGQKILRW